MTLQNLQNLSQRRQQYAFSYQGVPFRLEWDDPELDERMKALILPIWEPTNDPSCDAVFRLERTPRNRFRVIAPNLGFHTIPKPDPVETLERKLHLYLALQAKESIYVHAGVVRIHNQTVVIPGRCFAGKSSLVRALAEDGATFISDEYAVIDKEGLVHPFPRPISLRTPEGFKRVNAIELGWDGLLNPTRISYVVQTEYLPKQTWSPDILGTGEALLALFENTITAQTQPVLALSCLSRAVSNALLFKGPRGEAKETSRALMERLAQPIKPHDSGY